MSNLKLGPEGRKLLEQSSNASTDSAITLTRQMDLDSQIQYLVGVLSSTGPAEVKAILLNVVYYLPKAKQEGHVAKIITALLSSPLLFADGHGDFDGLYTVIEAMGVAFDAKIKVSSPTVSSVKFFNAVLSGILSCNGRSGIDAIKQNLVIAGICLARPTLEKYSMLEEQLFYDQFFKTVVKMFIDNTNQLSLLQGGSQQTYEIKALNLLALSWVFPIFEDLQKRHLNHLDIALFGFDLVLNSSLGLKNFEPFITIINDSDVKAFKQRPVLKLFNKLASVLKNAVTEVGHLGRLDVLQASMDRMLLFSQSVYSTTEAKQEAPTQHQEYWNLLKEVVFFSVMVFQGYADFVLSSTALTSRIAIPLFSKRILRDIYYQVALRILKSLFFLHFIIETIGTGGFLMYKFVMEVNTDLLQQSKLGEPLSDFFLCNINFNNLIDDTMNRAKLIFVLGYWESLVLTCSSSYFDSVVNPVVTDFIAKPYRTVNFSKTASTREILESAHSVKLSSLLLETNAQTNCLQIVDYLESLLRQFPTVLSSNQLNLAVDSISSHTYPEAVIGQFNKDLQHQLLQKLYLYAALEPSGKKSGEFLTSANSSAVPPTVKSGYIIAFIQALPYIQDSQLRYWLQEISREITKCNQEEKHYCDENLWNTISSELGLVKANIAIDWWYKQGRQSVHL